MKLPNVYIHSVNKKLRATVYRCGNSEEILLDARIILRVTSTQCRRQEFSLVGAETDFLLVSGAIIPDHDEH